MNHGANNNTGENQRDIAELEALQQQRLLLAYRANASSSARMQSAGLNGSSIQPPMHNGLSIFGNPTVPTASTLPSGILNLPMTSINAQQILLGSRTAGLPNISSIGMLGASGISLQTSLSAPSVARTGLNPLHMLPATAYQRALLERSQQEPPALPSIPQNDSGLPSVEASTSQASLELPNVSIISRTEKSGGDGALPRTVFVECDLKHLSEYQCLLRQQIEFFESSQHDMKWNIQGRNKAIAEGQVGLRCKWCAHIPINCRSPGAVYYSSSLDGLYQAAQNMAKNHFCKECNHVPASIKKHLALLRESRRRAPGGKRYWAEGARALGIYECKEGGLRFKKKDTTTSS